MRSYPSVLCRRFVTPAGRPRLYQLSAWQDQAVMRGGPGHSEFDLSDVLWASDLTFRLWSYSVGHSQLLLSSQTGADARDWAEVLFEAVVYMQLHTMYRGIALRELAAGHAAMPGIELPSSRPFLRMSVSSKPAGLVVCSRVTVVQRRASDDESRNYADVLASRVAAR